MPELSDKAAGQIGRWIGGGGALTALLTLAAWQIDTARTEAKSAIQVAVQHGEEFVDVRHRMNNIEARVATNEAQMKIGGRFTRDDGNRLQQQIDAAMARIRELEQR